MLKNLHFSGAFHDDNLTVDIMLENPGDYGLEASTLLFSVTVRGKSGADAALTPEDCTFYVMDEANRLHNTRSTPLPAIEVPADDEPSYRPGWLIHTGFKPEFLFQDLRIAFYHRSYQNIIIIELRH